MDKLKIEPWTALVIVVSIAGVIAMAYLKADVAAIAAYSAAAIALAGALRQLMYTKPADVPVLLSVSPDGKVKATITPPKDGAK